MTKILIYQHQSSMNHGCEALVYTISEQIKNAAHESDLTVASFYKRDDDLFYFPNVDHFIQNDQWLTRMSFPWFMYQLDKRMLKNKAVQEIFMYCKPCYEAAKQSDICVAIGGDTYCYNKGKEHWPLERKIKKLGKKMMLWGCSVEPEDIPGEMAEHLSLFDVITVRDPISYKALIENGVKSKIVRCADPAFLLPAENWKMPEGWYEGRMIGLNFSPMVMGNVKGKEQTRKAVYELVEYILATGDNVALIPHVRLSFSNDMEELRPVYEQFKNSDRVLLIDDKTLNARQLKYCISKCRIFVGARTHATIAAYSTGVPTLSIGYSVKARGIARDLFGCEEGMTISVKELAGTTKLIDAYRYINDNAEALHQRLVHIMPEYSQKALASGEAFQNLVRGKL